jgi:NTE family protein
MSAKKSAAIPLKKSTGKKKIAIALQGGGSHGAYTWGILERLLEEDKFDIRGFCGASSGAQVAAVTTYGLHIGGSKGAIDMLGRFWGALAEGHKKSFLQPGIFDGELYPGGLDYSPGYHFMSSLAKIFSPYDMDPFDLHPNHLKGLLLSLIDFEELKKSDCKLFVSATNVKTCKPKVFGPSDLSINALLASSALPVIFKALEIDGEFYWDGGYLGNPPIDPLIDGTDSNDILTLKINPTFIKEEPRSSKDIHDRIGQISLSTSLMAEMRMLAFQEEVLKHGFDLDGRIRKINYHEISADDTLEDLGLTSKFNHSFEFLNLLRKRGHAAGDKWLKDNYDKVENESTVDLKKTYT